MKRGAFVGELVKVDVESLAKYGLHVACAEIDDTGDVKATLSKSLIAGKNIQLSKIFLIVESPNNLDLTDTSHLQRLKAAMGIAFSSGARGFLFNTMPKLKDGENRKAALKVYCNTLCRLMKSIERFFYISNEGCFSASELHAELDKALGYKRIGLMVNLYKDLTEDGGGFVDAPGWQRKMTAVILPGSNVLKETKEKITGMLKGYPEIVLVKGKLSEKNIGQLDAIGV